MLTADYIVGQCRRPGLASVRGEDYRQSLLSLGAQLTNGNELPVRCIAI